MHSYSDLETVCVCKQGKERESCNPLSVLSAEGNQMCCSCVKTLICLGSISTSYFHRKWVSALTGDCLCSLICLYRQHLRRRRNREREIKSVTFSQRKAFYNNHIKVIDILRSVSAVWFADVAGGRSPGDKDGNFNQTCSSSSCAGTLLLRLAQGAFYHFFVKWFLFIIFSAGNIPLATASS